jgi:hypothetical protein
MPMRMDVDPLPSVPQDDSRPEEDQDHPDRQLKRNAQPRGDRKPEAEDHGPHGEEGRGVADPPDEPDGRGPPKALLLAHDGGDRDDVIGLQGVTKTQGETDEKEPQR